MTLGSWTRRPGWEPAIRWHMSRPFRALAGIRALPRGRGFCSRMAIGIGYKTIEPGSAIYAQTPGNGSVEFEASTVIGRAFWTMGTFEQSELFAAFRLAVSGTYAFDVGANVGLFTVVMSRAVGPKGRVVAVEPVADTIGALRRNLVRNHCGNVDVVEGAAAASTGEVPLLLTDDPALHSAGGKVIRGHPTIHTTTVKAYTLDEMWIAAGEPLVSLVKIDVEGGEEGVLLGAAEMIRRCQPTLIIEVNDPEDMQRVTESLHRYRSEPARGFEPRNYLFVPE
jgi:FkbM family methyltransferase